MEHVFPVVGKQLNRPLWRIWKDSKMTNETELHTRIRQLEDENERLSRIAGSKRAETARACLVAAWGNYDMGGHTGKYVAEAIMNDMLELEQALADQAERERLGLGKQAELENGNG